MNEQMVREHLQSLAARIEPGPAPIERTVEVAAAATRQGRAWVAVAGLATAAAIVLLAVLTLRGPESAPPEPTTPGSVSGLTWWSNHELHLGSRALTVADGKGSTEWMLATPDGAVLARANGEITTIDLDGRLVTIGSFDPDNTRGPSLVRDVVTGWIAWTDGEDITVFDPAAGPDGQIVESRATGGSFRGPTVWLIAIDDGVVYWDDSVQESRWDVRTGENGPTKDGGTYVRGARQGGLLVSTDVNTDALGWLADGVDAGPRRAVVPVTEGITVPVPGPSPSAGHAAVWDFVAHRMTVTALGGPSVGSSQALDLPAAPLVAASWISDTEVAVLLQSDDERVLHRCEVRSGQCNVVASGTDLVITSEPSWMPGLDGGAS